MKLLNKILTGLLPNVDMSEFDTLLHHIEDVLTQEDALKLKDEDTKKDGKS